MSWPFYVSQDQPLKSSVHCLWDLTILLLLRLKNGKAFFFVNGLFSSFGTPCARGEDACGAACNGDIAIEKRVRQRKIKYVSFPAAKLLLSKLLFFSSKSSLPGFKYLHFCNYFDCFSLSLPEFQIGLCFEYLACLRFARRLQAAGPLG